MPTKIFIRGGVSLTVRGDGPGAIIKRFLRPMAVGIGMNNHIVEFRWRDRLFLEAQPEAEYQAQIAEAEAKQKKQEEEQKAAKEKIEADRQAALKKSAEDFIAKYGPEPANWPESMRPKAQAPPLVTP